MQIFVVKQAVNKIASFFVHLWLVSSSKKCIPYFKLSYDLLSRHFLLVGFRKLFFVARRTGTCEH